MSIWESIRLALEGVWANKMRSTLTMLGIIIGIASVIAVVAIGLGGQKLLESEIEKVFGVNIFRVYVDWQSERTGGIDFTLDDVDVLKKAVPELKTVSANNDTYTPIRGSKSKETASLVGSTTDYFKMQNIRLLRGRLFNEADLQARRPVIVLDEKLAKNIFGYEDSLGKKVTVRKSQFIVIGIVENKQSFINGNRSIAYAPLTSWQDAYNTRQIFYLEGQAENREVVKQAMEKSVKVLERRHRNEGRYKGTALEQEMAQVNQMTSIITLVIGSIAGISLLVGGIGVMNIMLVSVTERTREIGIRKALGAQRKDIMLQFLIESMVLCIIGGLIGMALGIGGTLLVSLVVGLPPLVSWVTVIVAFLFSSTVGIFFGLYPANKASKLDPIEALRFE